MITSSFYHNLPLMKGDDPEWLIRFADYSGQNNQRLYLLSHPIVDSQHITYNNHFILLAPGFKLCIVEDTTANNFEEYEEDIKGDIQYLYQKYDYRPIMGRYSSVEKEFVTTMTLDSFGNISEVMEKLKLHDSQQKRKSELLIALCIGSINEISKVGIEVPNALVDKIRHKIQLFDGDQTRFIFDSPKGKIIKIQGLSGTGKTELLMHKLKELYLSSDDAKIFFTCHNRILAASLKDRIQLFFNYMKVQKQLDWEKRLWCANAWGRSSNINSGFYRYICHYYGLSFHSYLYSNSFENLCRLALEELKSKGDEIKPAFDYIIVDESQDFGEQFELLCKAVCAKQVLMAGDVFQSIFVDHIAKDYKADYMLGQCYRTAPDTLMFAHALCLGLFEEKRYRWLSDEDWKTCGYNIAAEQGDIILSRVHSQRFTDDTISESIIMRKLKPKINISQYICDIIKEINLENSGKLLPDDIAIIFIDETNDNYGLANQIALSINETFGWETNKAYESKRPLENTVLISNKNNAKGLEYSYVICVTKKIENNYQYRNTLYTMLTRSFIRSYLVFTDPDYNIPDEISIGLQQILRSHSMRIRNADEEEKKQIKIRFKDAKKALTLNEVIEKYFKDHHLDNQHMNTIMDILIMRGITGCKEEAIIASIDEIYKFISNGRQ